MEAQLCEACSEGQMDVIDSLLILGVDVNAPDNDGILPLQRACDGKGPWVIDVVTKLITHGADVDLENRFGDDTMCYAVSAEPFQSHVAQLVLDCSKKGVNRLDEDYANYLWCANTPEAAKFLVQNGIDVNNVCQESTYLDICLPSEVEYLRSVGAKLYSEL